LSKPEATSILSEASKDLAEGANPKDVKQRAYERIKALTAEKEVSTSTPPGSPKKKVGAKAATPTKSAIPPKSAKAEVRTSSYIAQTQDKILTKLRKGGPWNENLIEMQKDFPDKEAFKEALFKLADENKIALTTVDHVWEGNIDKLIQDDKNPNKYYSMANIRK
jgi:hypothetical protein